MRFAIIVDAWGRTGEVRGGKQSKGLGEGDVKGVCFCKFLLNPVAPSPRHPCLRNTTLNEGNY